MSESPYDFYPASTLISRLQNSAPTRKIVFLVGSPLSTEDSNGKLLGVPGVDGVINIVRDELRGNQDSLNRFDGHISSGKGVKYQEAFRILLGERGQDVINTVIRKAVLNAHTRPLQGDSIVSLSDEGLRKLEEDNEAWYLPKGIKAIGEIMSRFPEKFATTILTSNFDPLLGISIKRFGGKHYRTVLDKDGNLNQTTAEGVHVVHFHGYWFGCDTLHTPLQLNQSRPQLKSSLLNLLANSTVVVLGYGGWDDIFTQTLMELPGDVKTRPDIIWTFFDDKDDVILKKCKNVLQKLEPGIRGGRVTLFKGVDCHSFLPNLCEKLKDESRVSKVLPKRHECEATSCDNPPITKEWVGRESELNLLMKNDSPVAIITGIGGHGKSSLAGQYVQQSEKVQSFEFWDWRDCREEGDTLQTQLVSVIDRFTKGEIGPYELQGQDLKAIVDVLFAVIKNSKNMFVFDNVDHYIDLETFSPVSGMQVLVDKAVSIRHSSRFVFTCRPKVQHDSPHVLHLRLENGLTLNETEELFKRLKVPPDELKFVNQAYELTKGHPLWLNLLAVQTNRGRSLSELLRNIKKGKGDLPENTLRSIWATLKDDQQYVLRMMAELIKPSNEENLAQLVGKKLNYNRFSKAMKILRALNLVVIKSGGVGPESVELHPLIREFIHGNFPKTEQREFFVSLIAFYDEHIGKYRGVLLQAPSVSILDYWTQKVELSTNHGQYGDALSTLSEVIHPMISRGYAEEFVRLAREIFLNIDWAAALLTNSSFDSVFSRFIEILVQLGDKAAVSEMLEKYVQSIPGKSAQYINYCDLMCNQFWYEGDYETAIFWGEKGENLRTESKVTTNFSTAHNLALARRDSGKYDLALSYFLKGKELDSLLGSENAETIVSGAGYGNIGRCLYFKKELKAAVNCYKKSLSLIENEEQNSTSPINRGYARAWIADALCESNQFDMAYCFYRAAYERWVLISPPRAQQVLGKIEMLLIKRGERNDLEGLTIQQLERKCEKWLKEK